MAVALAPMQCDYFDAHRCRSCALMGVPYAVQLADKQQHCAAVLSEVARGVTWLPALESPESGFRNKAKLVVGGDVGAVTLGILIRPAGASTCGTADSMSPDSTSWSRVSPASSTTCGSSPTTCPHAGGSSSTSS